MWLAEVLGRMRGEKVQLQNNPATTWRCDPHAIVRYLTESPLRPHSHRHRFSFQVPFQPNCYDCGVHTLWHLQHILEFGLVRSRCDSPRLRFSDNMIGKHLILAQEILDDCGLGLE